jgi:hypothetical protein
MATRLKPRQVSASKLTFLAILLGLASIAGAQNSPVKRKLIVMGYDLGGNKAAIETLEKMSKAARDAGVDAQTILSEQDEASLNTALTKAFDAVKDTAGKLVIQVERVVPGDPARIVVRHTPVATTNKAAWIGFYREGAASKDYLNYTFLNNLTERLYDVTAPGPGRYNFRLFLDQGYEAAATSELITLEP